MRILALDHGSARCGCAISDPTGTIVRPIEPISPPDPAAVAAAVDEHGAEMIARRPAGRPRRERGRPGGGGTTVRRQVAALVDVPVETYDERLTTRLAARPGGPGPAPPRTRSPPPTCSTPTCLRWRPGR